jgi:hypothetical protein
MIALQRNGKLCRIFLVLLALTAIASQSAVGARYCEGRSTCGQCHDPPGDRRCWRPSASNCADPRYAQPDHAPLLPVVSCILAFASGVAVALALARHNVAGTGPAKRSTVATRVLVARLEADDPWPQQRW